MIHARSPYIISDHWRTIVALGLIVPAAALAGILVAVDLRFGLLFFALFAAVPGVFVALKMPGFIFAAYLCIPFYKAGLQPYFPVDLTLILALLSIAQLIFMLPPFTPAAERLVLTRYRWRGVLAWSALTALLLIGVVYAPYIDQSRDDVTDWILLVFAPCLGSIRIANNPRYLRQFIYSLFAIGLIVVIAGIYLLPSVGAWPNDRLRVFGSHTIRVGQAALLVPLISVLYVLRSASPVVKIASLIAIPPALLVAASSGSRGPLLMLAVCTAIFGLRRLVIWATGTQGQTPRLAPLRFLLPALLGMVILVTVPISTLLSFIPETSAARLASISAIFSGVANQDLSAESPDQSTEGRLIAYDFAEELFAESPIFGHGTGSFAPLVARDEPLLNWDAETAHPHNLILQFAAEFGLVGLVVLVVLVGLALQRGWRADTDPAWHTILVLFVFFFLGAMVSTDLYDNRTLWGLLVLLLFAPQSVTARQTRTTSSNIPRLS